VATWEDVRNLALAMPGVEEAMSRGTPVWRVGKLVVWERPMRKRDIEELGDALPPGPIMGAAVSDEGEKRALIASDPEVFFTTHHFDGHAIVLVQLERIARDQLSEVIIDAWLAVAPKRLVAEYEERAL
jgi:hypothetical protein